MRASVFLVVVVCCVLGGFSCDLACFLKKLHVSVPNVELRGKFVLHYDFSASSIACSNFSVNGFSSFFNGATVLDLGVPDVTFNCSGLFDVKWGSLHEQGPFNVHGYGGVSAGIEMINNVTSGLAERVQVDSCNASAQVEAFFNGKRWFDELEKFIKKTFHKFIEDSVQNQLCAFVSNLGATDLTQLVQFFNVNLGSYLEPPAPVNVPAPTSVTLANLNNNSFVKMAVFFVQQVLGPAGLNRALAAVNASSFDIPVNQQIASLPFGVAGNMAVLNVAIGSLSVSGIFDSWKAFLLEPSSQYTMHFKTSLDGPISLNVSFAYNITTAYGDQFNAMGLLYTTLSNMTFNSYTDIFANQTFFNNLRFEQILNVPCVASGLVGVNITQLLVNTWVHQFQISNVLSNETDEVQFDRLLDNVFQLILTNYAPFIPPLIDSFLDSSVRAGLNNLIASSNVNGSGTCFLEDFAGPYVGLNFISVTVASSVWFMAFCVTLIVSCLVAKKRSDRRWRLYGEIERVDALCIDGRIPWVVRVLVSLCIFLCFAVNNITCASTSAYLVLRLRFSEESLISNPLYIIDLVSSVQQAWDAGVYQMAIVLVVFQVVVPYVKLICMSLCWMLPLNVLPRKHQIRMLYFFDAMGRFQLVSGFILVIYGIAFHFVVATPPPPPLSFIETFIVVHADFWIFMGVTVLSMLVNSYMLHVSRSFHYEPCKLDLRPPVALNVAVLVSMIVSAGLMVVGFLWPVFTVTFEGLGGYLLSLVGVSEERTFTLIGAWQGIREGWLDPSSLPAFTLQVFFFILAIAIPCIEIVVSFVAWFNANRFVFYLLEQSVVWASLDVFIGAVLASVVSLKRYGRFMVGDRCDLINALIEKYAPNTLDDPRCIDVDSALLLGTYMFMAACVLKFVNAQLLMYWQRQALFQDKSESFGDRSDTDRLIN